MEQKNKYKLIARQRDLDKLFSKVDQKTRDLIKNALIEIQYPYQATGIKKLKGNNGQKGYRKKVGDYRICFLVDKKEKEIKVYDIFHRERGYQ